MVRSSHDTGARHSSKRGSAARKERAERVADDAYFTEITRGVEETLEQEGLSMVLTATHEEPPAAPDGPGGRARDGRRDPGAPRS